MTAACFSLSAGQALGLIAACMAAGYFGSLLAVVTIAILAASREPRS